MSIELKINVESVGELHDQLRALLAGTAASAAPPAAEPKAARGAGGGKTADANKTVEVVVEEPTPKAETPPAEEANEPASDGEIQFPDETGVPSEDELKDPNGFYLTTVKPNVLRVSAKHGRPGVEKLMADFEVGNAQQIPKERYRELFAAIDKLLEG